MNQKSISGFTLIEMSIVLVIIGLIVGGVLVGQDLIHAAEVRAQITQIEKYNTAVNTFRGKYNALPGDMNGATATQFGFSARGSSPGEGDGNGVIEGNAAVGACGFCAGFGEPLVVWVDLAKAQLIEGGFNSANDVCGTCLGANSVTGTYINLYLPASKIGTNYVYAWSGGAMIDCCSPGQTGSDSQNYFGLSMVSVLVSWQLVSNVGLTVKQAYNIDVKIDDGLPQSGRVTSLYLDYSSSAYSPVWAGSGGRIGTAWTTATAGSNNTCFDNSTSASGTPGAAGLVQHYSLEMNNATGVNCALSFKFQ